MKNSTNKGLISFMIQYGIELIKDDKVTLDDLITSDRLLIELYCGEFLEFDHIKFHSAYYDNEEHIHDVIEYTINSEVL